jgi:uncharacterized membrane protein
MEKLITITLPDLQRATQAWDRLKELDQIGDVIIYNGALITNTGNKKYELVRHEGPDTSGLPAAAAIGGSLIGAIGGPIGVFIGMITGLAVGSADDGEWINFSHQFMDEVNKGLTEGTYAIILDVDEDNVSFIDTYMQSFPGTVIRADIAAQIDRYEDDQLDKLNADIDYAEKSLKSSVDKDKAALKSKISTLKQNLAERKQKVKLRTAERKRQLEEKVRSFDHLRNTAGRIAADKIKANKERVLAKIKQIDKKINSALV